MSCLSVGPGPGVLTGLLVSSCHIVYYEYRVKCNGRSRRLIVHIFTRHFSRSTPEHNQEQAAGAAGRQVASVFSMAAAAGSIFFKACAFLAEQPRAEAGARHLCVSRACVGEAKG